MVLEDPGGQFEDILKTLKSDFLTVLDSFEVQPNQLTKLNLAVGYSHAGTNLIQTSHLAIEKTKAQKVCLKSQVRCVAMSLVLCQLLGTDDLDKHHQERGNAGVYCITWLALQGQVPEPKSSIISKLLLQSFNFLGISLIVS